jgi:hypothetical protein
MVKQVYMVNKASVKGLYFHFNSAFHRTVKH